MPKKMVKLELTPNQAKAALNLITQKVEENGNQNINEMETADIWGHYHIRRVESKLQEAMSNEVPVA